MNGRPDRIHDGGPYGRRSTGFHMGRRRESGGDRSRRKPVEGGVDRPPDGYTVRKRRADPRRPPQRTPHPWSHEHPHRRIRSEVPGRSRSTWGTVGRCWPPRPRWRPCRTIRKKHGKDARRHPTGRIAPANSPPSLGLDRPGGRGREVHPGGGRPTNPHTSGSPPVTRTGEGEFIAWCLEAAAEGAWPHPPGDLPGGHGGGRCSGPSPHPGGVDNRMVESALVPEVPWTDWWAFAPRRWPTPWCREPGPPWGGSRPPPWGRGGAGAGAGAPCAHPLLRGPGRGREGWGSRCVSTSRTSRRSGGMTPGRRTRSAPSARSWPRPPSPPWRPAGEVTLAEAPSLHPEFEAPPTLFPPMPILQAAGGRLGWSPKEDLGRWRRCSMKQGHITYHPDRLQPPGGIRGEEGRGAGGVPPGGASSWEPGHRTWWPPDPPQDRPRGHRAHPSGGGGCGLGGRRRCRRLYRLIRGPDAGTQMGPRHHRHPEHRGTVPGLRPPPHGKLSPWETFAGWRAAWTEFAPSDPPLPPDIPLEAGAIWTLDPPRKSGPIHSSSRTRRSRRGGTRPPHPHQGHEGRRDRAPLHLQPHRGEAWRSGSTWRRRKGALVPTERGRVDLDRCGSPLRPARPMRDRSAMELFSPEFTSLMEEGLDDGGSEGGGSAPERVGAVAGTPIRDLHESAREKRNCRLHDLPAGGDC